MNLKIRCPKGHEWELVTTNSTVMSAPICPVCSEQGQTEGTIAPATTAPEATLMTAQFRTGEANTEAIGKADLTMQATTSERTDVHGYEILSELGRGGMGVVYKARQKGLNRIVALKMILAGGHAGKGDLERFRNEAEAVAQLQHPNIVQIYEVGEDQGKPFFSLEYIDGGSLDRKTAGLPQTPRFAATTVETLARAMHFAHQHGVLHRDLKPANVLQTELGTLKITDFGLAKRMDAESGQTHSGSILGTPSYMAPEQARGQSRDIGPQADVYALGAILYDLLTGRPPFRASSAWDTISQVIHDEPVRPTQLDSKVPRDLETICLKALQKEPRRRYGSAEELADDLKHFLAGEPIQARPIGSGERLVKWARRRPAVAALSAISLLVTVIGIALVTWQWQEARAAYSEADLARHSEKKQKEDAQNARDNAEKRERAEAEARLQADLDRKEADRARQEADRARQRAEQERQRAEAALAKARVLLLSNRLSWAEREGSFSNPQEAFTILEGVEQADRDWEWHYLYRTLQGSLMTLEVGGQNFLDAAFSPDRKQIATIGNDSIMRFWDTATGKQTREIRAHTQCGFGVDYSPDGTLIASVGWDSHARIWDAKTGVERARMEHGNEKVYRILFSPDGKRLATTCQDGIVRIWDLDGKEKAVCKGHIGYTVGLAFSSDGKRLATAGAEGIVRVWDTATGEEKLTLKGHQGAVRGVAYSPDDTFLASASMDQTVRIWDAQSGDLKRILRGHTGSVMDVAFSPNGALLVSTGLDRKVRVWQTADWNTLQILGGHGHGVISVRFSKDGQYFVTGAYDNMAKIWPATRDTRLLVIQGHKGTINDLAISKDGKWLASGSADGMVIVSEAETGAKTFSFEDLATPVRALVFHPEGNILAGSDGGGIIHLWDMKERKSLRTLQPEKDAAQEARCLAFSPDGKWLASGGKGALKLWDVKEGKVARALPVGEGRIWSVAFSPSGDRLVTGDNQGKIQLWDLKGEPFPRTMLGHTDTVYRVVFDGEGKRVISCGEDNTVRVWDVETRKEVVNKDIMQRVRDIALHPEGRRIALACEDGSIRLLDSRLGEESYRLRKAHSDAVRCVRFDSIGRRLISAGNDRLIKVWDSVAPTGLPKEQPKP